MVPFSGGLLDQFSSLLSFNPSMIEQTTALDSLAVSMTKAVLLFMLFQFVLGVVYGALMEGSESGATLGKRYCGLRVTDKYGERIGYGAAVIRNIGVNLMGVALSIRVNAGLILAPAYLLALFTKRKQALHDLAAKTIVIYVVIDPPSSRVSFKNAEL